MKLRVSLLFAVWCSPLLGLQAQAPAAKPQGAQVQAQDPITITTRVTPDQPRVGDLITYQINVAYPQGYAVNLPRLLDLKPLTVVETQEGQEASSGQGLVRQFSLVLQAFSLKNAKIPSFELTYVDTQAQVHTKRVPSQKLDMHAMTANEAEPERRGEDPMVSPEYPNRKAELALLAILGGVLLSGLGYGLWRWLAPDKNAPAPVPVVPPHVVATQRLDRLESGMEQRFADGAGVLFYLELTEVAKGYLGSRHDIECLDRTTFEIEEMLRKDPALFGPVSSDSVRGFLRNCDLIKFARVATDLDDAKGQLQELRDWIELGQQADAKTPASGASSAALAMNAGESAQETNTDQGARPS